VKVDAGFYGSHNPYDEFLRVSCLRENLTSSSEGEGLETDRNAPRQSFTRQIFHKEVKSYLGFQDVAAKSFTSVKAHVHWVYCAYILLHARLPGIPDSLDSLPDRQRKIKEIVDSKEKVRMIQLLTQMNK
jgi:hypothetical protein